MNQSPELLRPYEGARRPRMLVLSWYSEGRLDAGERIRFSQVTRSFENKFEVLRLSFDTDELPRGTTTNLPTNLHHPYRVLPRDYIAATLTARSIEKYILGRDRELRKWVRCRATEFAPDVIWVNQPFAWTAVPSEFNDRAIVDTHNVNSDRLDRVAAAREAPIFVRIAARIQARLSRTFEREYVNGAARVVAVSETDRNSLARHCADSARVITIGNGAEFGEVPSRLVRTTSPTAAAPLRILFLGSLSYSANISALKRLATWLAEVTTPVVVTVAGSGDPDEAARICAGEPRLHFVGRVDDAKVEMAQHEALVAPHSQGGGSRIKILEALAAKLPVIATEVAAEGLELVPGEHFLSVETGRELEAALALLCDTTAMASMTEQGYAIARRHDWHSLSEAASSLALEVAREFGQPGPVSVAI